jgi:hypothetical protein
VLTSRPSSWKGQISIDQRDPRHHVVTLLPLEYPNAVEAAIDAWHEAKPDSARLLKDALRSSPQMIQAARIPLILAFYCIIADEGELPATRRDLYNQVVRKLLRGSWRREASDEVDTARCADILTEWAWAAAQTDPDSGLGTWLDEFETALPSGLPGVDRSALDNVCAPVAVANDKLDTRRRRFLHRSIQEHLVAEYVARLPYREAAKTLLSHCW